MKSLELSIENSYSNELATDRFVRMLDDPTQCYKFYWLDAVMILFPNTEEDLTFDEIFNEMIFAAWYSVTKFHLRLGPMVNSAPVNLLERAVHIIEDDAELSQPVCRKDILLAIKRNDAKLKDCKEKLARNVPYRLLSSFIDNYGGNDRIWDQKSKLIHYIDELNNSICLPYTIIDGKSLQKKIHLDTQWRKFLLDNYSVIRSWIQLKKVQFLQDRNPGVPGIIYKLDDNSEDGRKLEHARKLWTVSTAASNELILDIYTGNPLEKNRFSLDHFIPWSYIANDELWNLTPTDPVVNSRKGNRLPKWEKYFVVFANNQYWLYKTIFSIQKVRDQFEKCRKNNLNSIWASEMLYVENHSEEQFKSILEQYLHPVYESARLQGFSSWNY